MEVQLKWSTWRELSLVIRLTYLSLSLSFWASVVQPVQELAPTSLMTLSHPLCSSSRRISNTHRFLQVLDLTHTSSCNIKKFIGRLIQTAWNDLKKPIHTFRLEKESWNFASFEQPLILNKSDATRKNMKKFGSTLHFFCPSHSWITLWQLMKAITTSRCLLNEASTAYSKKNKCTKIHDANV